LGGAREDSGYRRRTRTRYSSARSPPSDDRAGLRAYQAQPPCRLLPTPRQSRLPLRMATNHRHPQPPKAPQTPHSCRGNLKRPPARRSSTVHPSGHRHEPATSPTTSQTLRDSLDDRQARRRELAPRSLGPLGAGARTPPSLHARGSSRLSHKAVCENLCGARRDGRRRRLERRGRAERDAAEPMTFWVFDPALRTDSVRPSGVCATVSVPCDSLRVGHRDARPRFRARAVVTRWLESGGL
jgi:hypothetical protein